MNPEAEIACSCARVAIGNASVPQLVDDMERLLFAELVPKAAAGECSAEFQDLMVNLYSHICDGNDDLAAAVAAAFDDAIKISYIAEYCPMEAIIYQIDQVNEKEKLCVDNAKCLATMPWASAANQATDQLKFKINEFASDIRSFVHEVDDGFVDPAYNDEGLFCRAVKLAAELRSVI